MSSFSLLDETLPAPLPIGDWSRIPGGEESTPGALQMPYDKETGTMYGLGEQAAGGTASVEFQPDASVAIQELQDGSKQYNYVNTDESYYEDPDQSDETNPPVNTSDSNNESEDSDEEEDYPSETSDEEGEDTEPYNLIPFFSRSMQRFQTLIVILLACAAAIIVAWLLNKL